MDYKAKEGVITGKLSTATPAAIGQAYRIHLANTSRTEIKGRTYLTADKGPFRARVHRIGKAGMPNAAHCRDAWKWRGGQECRQ